MRVCIDCSPLLMRSGGIKTYLHHLIRELQSLRGREVEAFPFLKEIPPLNHERSAASALGTWLRIAALVSLNRGILPAAWVGSRADVFHASNQMRRVPGSRRLTATIHDMSSWLMPQFHTSDTVRADREYAERILGRADGLIAVSQKSKLDAMQILGLPPERIQVIYHGVEETYFDVAPQRISEVQSANSLAGPYILFVSTIEPRKNLDRLINAYQAMSPSLRGEFELVVAGPAGWHSEETLNRLRSGIPGVKYLGYVAEHHLPGLFAGAAVFAYPSLYEGFGLPMLQALAAGTPVIASNAGSLQEVGGDAVRYVDPASEDEIRVALSELLLSPSVRSDRSKRGLAHARAFSWSKCAGETWGFFERVAQG